MQMQKLGAYSRPHAVNNHGSVVQMQGPGASMAGGLLNQVSSPVGSPAMQPIGVAGGMPAPAPIPTQQLQTQYTQLMAYIAQQQKALQTCTLVLQAGGLPGLCVRACLSGLQSCTRTLQSRWAPRTLREGVSLRPAVMRTQVCKAGGSPSVFFASQPRPQLVVHQQPQPSHQEMKWFSWLYCQEQLSTQGNGSQLAEFTVCRLGD